MKGQTNRHIREARLQRDLRNAPTDAERTLWQHLKGRQLEGCKFRRQHPFGDCILDFVCLDHGVVVELDGSQHADAADYDARRTRFLEAAGFVVLRFWNNDVFSTLEGVLETIQAQLIARARSGDFVPVRTPSPPNPRASCARESGLHIPVQPPAGSRCQRASLEIPASPLKGEG
jgi:very-short-patch-repair endonuclease